MVVGRILWNLKRCCVIFAKERYQNNFLKGDSLMDGWMAGWMDRCTMWIFEDTMDIDGWMAWMDWDGISQIRC